MVEGKYLVKLDTPLGIKSGIVNFKVQGENLTGSIEALDKVNIIENGRVNGDKFTFTGTLKTFVGKITYKAEGVVEGNTVKAKAKTSKGYIDLVGQRVK